LPGVFAWGFALLALGVAFVAAAAMQMGAGATALASVMVLAATIVIYDWWHKENTIGPLLMGLCRMLCYITAALGVAGSVNWAVIGAASAALCYLIGLTYIAKQETLGRVGNLWPLCFLAVPFVYEAPAALRDPASGLLFVALLAWVIYALWFLRPGVRAIGKSVGYLIAGICLLDALFIAQLSLSFAVLAVCAFGLTLSLHRLVPGT
jgi:hypothetical protein